MLVRTLPLSLACVLALSSTLLAERPSSRVVRDKEATHVYVGAVKAVYARDVGTSRIQTHYLVELEVEVVERGKGLAKGDLAYVRCWQLKKQASGMDAGASGHNPIPKAGDRVRAFVAKGPYSPTRQKDKGTTAVYPNGFEVLPSK